MQDDNQADAGWAERAEPKRRIRSVLYGACAALVVAELIVHRHTENAIEELPAFYAVYGLVSLIAAVFAARGLRRLVRRNEDYYDRDA